METGCYCLSLPQAPSFWLANAPENLGCYLISYYLRVASLYSAQCDACSSQKHKTGVAPVWEKKGCIIQSKVNRETAPLPFFASPHLDTDVLRFSSKPNKKNPNKQQSQTNYDFSMLAGGNKFILLSEWYLGTMKIGSLWTAAVLIFGSLQRPSIAEGLEI